MFTSSLKHISLCENSKGNSKEGLLDSLRVMVMKEYVAKYVKVKFNESHLDKNDYKTVMNNSKQSSVKAKVELRIFETLLIFILIVI